MIGDKER